MKLQLVGYPDKFQRIVELSDAEYSRSESRPAAETLAEITAIVVTEIKERYETGAVDQLTEALDCLDEPSFRELVGWVYFGRDYWVSNGDPYTCLAEYIRDAIVNPRDSQSGLLEEKPIGNYLRNAARHLSGETAAAQK